MISIISKLLHFCKKPKSKQESDIEPLPKSIAADLGQRIFCTVEKCRRQRISNRTSKAMLKHQSAGRRMSHLTPFGWRRNPENDSLLIEDPAEQEIIEQIVALRKKGISHRKIGQTLEAEDILSRSGRSFHHSTIRKILKRKGVQ